VLVAVSVTVPEMLNVPPLVITPAASIGAVNDSAPDIMNSEVPPEVKVVNIGVEETVRLTPS
jgi:hypothetical protein